MLSDEENTLNTNSQNTNTLQDNTATTDSIKITAQLDLITPFTGWPHPKTMLCKTTMQKYHLTVEPILQTELTVKEQIYNV